MSYKDNLNYSALVVKLVDTKDLKAEGSSKIRVSDSLR